MITSPSNAKLRYVRRLDRRSFREAEQRMVIEGVRLTEEALDAGALPAFALVSEVLDTTPRGAGLRGRLSNSGVPVLDMAPKLLADLSGTVTPQGVLAVVPTPVLPLPAAPDLVLVLDGVRDPGNLGTALRTALAAGVSAVVVAPGTVDPTGRKVIRAAMGAHFRLPIRRFDWPAVQRLAEQADLSVLVADAQGQTAYAAVDWRRPSLLIVGGEAEGPCEAALTLGLTVRIPMPGPAESLNAAVAAAVILFEASRQRSAK